MNRKAEIERKTRETAVTVAISLDGKGQADISTGIPFFDHMLTLFAVHGFFDLRLRARETSKSIPTTPWRTWGL